MSLFFYLRVLGNNATLLLYFGDLSHCPSGARSGAIDVTKSKTSKDFRNVNTNTRQKKKKVWDEKDTVMEVDGEDVVAATEEAPNGL